jgi:nucleotide-binding universal stress UspA family protein
MYKHILVPTDGSKLSNAAVKVAAKLAGELGAKITALSVLEPYVPMAESEAVAFYAPYGEKQYDAAVHKAAARALSTVKVAAAAAKVKAESLTVTSTTPWRGIVDTARDKGCDLIIMASHGRSGMGALLLGSETQKVLTHSKIPVLVCR